MKRWILIRMLVLSLVVAAAVTTILIIWNNQSQHTSCIEAYYLMVEYSDEKSNENVSYNEVSMIDEAFFFVLFELDIECRYVIKYGHVQDGSVYDTQVIVVNHSTSKIVQPFHFHDEAMIGLYAYNRWSEWLIGMIYIKQY